MKVLIIEDELLIQKALAKLIEKEGHETEVTSSGREAISMIKNQEYDRIICDIMLKDITGFEIIEDCKQVLSLDDIKDKFVIMTAYSSEQIISNAKKYGCPIYKKPFENIVETVKSMIKKDLN